MSKSNKEVVVEKETEDGKVQAVATQLTLRGLLKHGWTVVDDGSKQEKQSAEAQAKEVKQLQEQEEKLFGSPDEE
jgi:hypothetical protein